MKRSAPAAILLATGILAGCSTSNPLEKKLDYKSAEPPKAGNTLEVPPDLTTPQIQNKYVIPATGSAQPWPAAIPWRLPSKPQPFRLP
jgi:outer membrane protein assembly factor BamC